MRFGKILLFPLFKAHGNTCRLCACNGRRPITVFLFQPLVGVLRIGKRNSLPGYSLGQSAIHRRLIKSAKECVDKSADTAFAKLFTQVHCAVRYHISLFVHKKEHIQGYFQNGTDSKLGGFGRVMADTKIKIPVVFHNPVNDFYSTGTVLLFNVGVRNRLLQMRAVGIHPCQN